jgi:hypothetical protein
VIYHGLRRKESADLQLEDYRPDTGLLGCPRGDIDLSADAQAVSADQR